MNFENEIASAEVEEGFAVLIDEIAPVRTDLEFRDLDGMPGVSRGLYRRSTDFELQ
jgi:hypothetical protein